MVKTINRKQFVLIVLIAYVVAYLIVGGVENYTVKNEYEQTKIESYNKEGQK